MEDCGISNDVMLSGGCYLREKVLETVLIYIDGDLVDKHHKTRIPISIHSTWQNT